MKTEKYPNYKVSQIENFQCYQRFGCLLSEPDKYLLTQAIILLVMVLYYIFTAPFIYNTGLLTVTIILHITVILISILLAYCDAGMLPPILPSYQSRDLHQIPLSQSHFLSSFQRTYILVSKTHLLNIKYCSICHIYRPSRTSHCYQCNVCIQKFDHHCPWIGNCVGKANYTWFITFLVTLALLGIIIIVGNAAVFQNTNVNTPILVVNIIICVVDVFAMVFVWILLGFHIYFSFTNVTTYQFCKQSWKSVSGNPFEKSKFLKNLIRMFISVKTIKKINPQQQKIERNLNRQAPQQSGKSTVQAGQLTQRITGSSNQRQDKNTQVSVKIKFYQQKHSLDNFQP